jgi:hypothetical protein
MPLTARASMVRWYIIWRNNDVYDERLRRMIDRATVLDAVLIRK